MPCDAPVSRCSFPVGHGHGRIRAATFARALIASGLVAGLCATGCARLHAPSVSPAAAPPIASVDAATDALQPVDTGGRGALLVRPDHQLGRYDDLLVDYVGFRYSEHQPWLSFEDEDRVSSVLDSAVRGSQDGAIGLAEEAGPCVLSIRFYVTDLELLDSDMPATSAVSFVRSFGEATMIMELRDSQSDETLARFTQRRSLGGGQVNQPGARASIHRLRRAVGAAMRDMGDQLREITPPSTSGWEGECRGGMTRVAFGSH